MLDENLGNRGADLLKEAGHDVATVFGQGLSGFADPDVINVCKAEGRCLVTLDVGFSNPLVFRPADYPGIAVLRLPRRFAYHHLVEAVQTLIFGLANDSIFGRLWIIQPSRIRIFDP
jgi:hypothetical protein